MLKRVTILLLIALFAFNAAIDAQERRKRDRDKDRDDEEEYFWSKWGKSKIFDWKLHGRPYMELNYGLSTVNHNLFTTKFNDLGMAELRLGYRDVNEGFEDYLINLREQYTYGSILKKDFTSASASPLKFNAEVYRFGFGSTDGLGYNLGPFAIIPYHGGAMGFTSFKKIQFAGVNPGNLMPDNEIIDNYGDTFRFSSVSEGGVKLEVASVLSINAGFEASAIYPRLMFWYWAGSAIIEGAGMGLIDHFIERVTENAPAAAPIVSFLLKNAYSYGFYLLKKDRMNWPFETIAPFTFETFKIGVTFTF